MAELGSALLASRYGMAKQVKEESAAYLKSWLGSLKEVAGVPENDLVRCKKGDLDDFAAD